MRLSFGRLDELPPKNESTPLGPGHESTHHLTWSWWVHSPRFKQGAIQQRRTLLEFLEQATSGIIAKAGAIAEGKNAPLLIAQCRPQFGAACDLYHPSENERRAAIVARDQKKPGETRTKNMMCV
jgi:hypothetical protein